MPALSTSIAGSHRCECNFRGFKHLQLLFGTLFQLIVYILTDQPQETSRFLMFWLTGILSATISEGFGILVGSLCGSAVSCTEIRAVDVHIGFFVLIYLIFFFFVTDR